MLEGSALLAAVLGALWAISEVLTFIPAIKGNGVFQVLRDLLASVLGKKDELDKSE